MYFVCILNAARECRSGLNWRTKTRRKKNAEPLWVFCCVSIDFLFEIFNKFQWVRYSYKILLIFPFSAIDCVLSRRPTILSSLVALCISFDLILELPLYLYVWSSVTYTFGWYALFVVSTDKVEHTHRNIHRKGNRKLAIDTPMITGLIYVHSVGITFHYTLSFLDNSWIRSNQWPGYLKCSNSVLKSLFSY